MSLNESIVEDAAVIYFGAMRSACLHCVEVDDAGERTGIESALLAKCVAEDSAGSIHCPSAVSRARRLDHE